MTTNNSPWVWSPEYKDYYCITGYDANGNPTYQWAGQRLMVPPQPVPLSCYRHDSVTFPSHTTPKQTEYINGTPGRHERLDPSYIVREGAECQQFFRKGRVLSMLWSEPAGSTSTQNGSNHAYTVVKFGERVYSSIRRFVIVSVPNNQAFVYACAITTYSYRGVLKDGCNPEDHAAVYFTGTAPSTSNEEVEAGMTNEAIRIDPAEPHMSMHWASRVNFGKTVAIEKNVKVKDIGRVASEHMSNLIKFWRVAKGEEDDD